MIFYDIIWYKKSNSQQFQVAPSDRRVWGLIIPIKKYRFCSHGEMDITIDFGSIFEGSNPSGSTIKPFILKASSDFRFR